MCAAHVTGPLGRHYLTVALLLQVIGDSSEETKQLMASQGVREVPSFHFFKGGERLGVVTGAKLSSMDLIDAIESVRWES